MERHPVILSIAGSDCSGGAGIQADIKTISALGGYAASAITAITVQNTLGVRAVQSISPDMVRGQIEAVMDDLQPVAIKIGMINDIQIVRVISDCLQKYSPAYVVYDPVMVSTSGRKLMTDEAIEEIKKELLPLVTLITPNIDEAKVLTGKSIHNIQDMQAAAKMLTDDYQTNILLKGGHLEGDNMCDLLHTSEFIYHIYEEKKIESHNLHGTGCTLSSAIATYLAKGYPMRESIQHAKTSHYRRKRIEYRPWQRPFMAFSGHRCTNVYFLCGCIIKIRNFAPAIKNQLNNKNMKAFVFPGQGAQFVGMGKDLYENSALAKELFEKANDILGYRITDIMFDGTDEDLRQTKVTQPAVFLHSVISALCMGDDFKPEMTAGHSLGEFSALVAAGALSFEDGLKLVYARAMAMQKACEATPSTMAAIIALPDEKVEEICAAVNAEGEVCVPANYNCPGQIVISGSVPGIEKACELMKAAGAKRALPLKVGGAFHSPLMDPAKIELEAAIKATEIHTPKCPVYQNVDALPLTLQKSKRIWLPN
jgi:malonyl CoA-acyl carrier protein transacylase